MEQISQYNKKLLFRFSAIPRRSFIHNVIRFYIRYNRLYIYFQSLSSISFCSAIDHRSIDPRNRRLPVSQFLPCRFFIAHKKPRNTCALFLHAARRKTPSFNHDFYAVFQHATGTCGTFCAKIRAADWWRLSGRRIAVENPCHHS